MDQRESNSIALLKLLATKGGIWQVISILRKNDGEVLALTVTTTLSVEDTASVTSHPVESGKNVADNIVVK